MYAKLMITVIQLYQKHLSHLLGRKCLFTPTCSEYSIQAFQKYGLLHGIKLTSQRFFRCKPPNGGFDPLK